MSHDNNQLGVLSEFWDGNHPHHLPLLNLDTNNSNDHWNLEISPKRLENIFHKYESKIIIRDLQALIEHRNWRPQLVFCISLLKLVDEDVYSLQTHLWNQIENARSWILPQLAVTASMVDVDFTKKAINILSRKIGVTAPYIIGQGSKNILRHFSYEESGFCKEAVYPRTEIGDHPGV